MKWIGPWLGWVLLGMWFGGCTVNKYRDWTAPKPVQNQVAPVVQQPVAPYQWQFQLPATQQAVQPQPEPPPVYVGDLLKPSDPPPEPYPTLLPVTPQRPLLSTSPPQKENQK
jgi:hypothetical protein